MEMDNCTEALHPAQLEGLRGKLRKHRLFLKSMWTEGLQFQQAHP